MTAAIEATGTVAALASEDGRATVEVVVEGASPCARCASGKGCGAGIFTGQGGQQRLRLPVPDGLTFAVGEAVTVSMQGSTLLMASVLAYGLPLAGLLAGGTVALLLSAGEILASGLALAGLAAGFAISRQRLRATCWRADTRVSLDRVA